MKSQIAIALTFAFAFVAVAHTCFGRTWTDHKGRKIEAEFISLADGKVTIKRANDGKTFDFPLDQLSDADQAFVRTQPKENGVPLDDRRIPVNDPKMKNGKQKKLDPLKAEQKKPVIVLWQYFYPAADFRLRDGTTYECKVLQEELVSSTFIIAYNRTGNGKSAGKVPRISMLLDGANTPTVVQDVSPQNRQMFKEQSGQFAMRIDTDDERTFFLADPIAAGNKPGVIRCVSNLFKLRPVNLAIVVAGDLGGFGKLDEDVFKGVDLPEILWRYHYPAAGFELRASDEFALTVTQKETAPDGSPIAKYVIAYEKSAEGRALKKHPRVCIWSPNGAVSIVKQDLSPLNDKAFELDLGRFSLVLVAGPDAKIFLAEPIGDDQPPNIRCVSNVLEVSAAAPGAADEKPCETLGQSYQWCTAESVESDGPGLATNSRSSGLNPILPIQSGRAETVERRDFHGSVLQKY